MFTSTRLYINKNEFCFLWISLPLKMFLSERQAQDKTKQDTFEEGTNQRGWWLDLNKELFCFEISPEFTLSHTYTHTHKPTIAKPALKPCAIIFLLHSTYA